MLTPVLPVVPIVRLVLMICCISHVFMTLSLHFYSLFPRDTFHSGFPSIMAADDFSIIGCSMSYSHICDVLT